MTWQWTGLAVFSLILLPAAAAMITGRVPRRLRRRPAPVRPRGWALLLICATAPVNALPRLAGASPGLTLACTAAGGGLAVAGCLVLGAAVLWRPRRAPAAPPEGAWRPAPPAAAGPAGAAGRTRRAPSQACDSRRTAP
ncbi:hypothetical protein ACFYNM_30810 [Streptomyces spororaveus]|uniref:hypothetical protein n=1 Tax=Streptomyces spororaveus TaxID=284039 RepID=UPI00367A3C74